MKNRKSMDLEYYHINSSSSKDIFNMNKSFTMNSSNHMAEVQVPIIMAAPCFLKIPDYQMKEKFLTCYPHQIKIRKDRQT